MKKIIFLIGILSSIILSFQSFDLKTSKFIITDAFVYNLGFFLSLIFVIASILIFYKKSISLFLFSFNFIVSFFGSFVLDVAFNIWIIVSLILSFLTLIQIKRKKSM